MFSYGTVLPHYINRNGKDETKWKIGKAGEDYPTEKTLVCSSQFALPKCENGPVHCRLFLDLDKKEIGIENVSSEKGSVVMTGSVSICYWILNTGKIY